jgi:hypothetical protein
MTKVWQIAAGEPGRYYDDLFIRHDIMFLGPGRHGPYNEANKAKYDQSVIANWRGMIRRFVEDVEPGDLILLRKSNKATALGQAAEAGYDWRSTFDDVFGWDLQHTRRVVWQPHLEAKISQAQEKGGFFAGEDRKSTRLNSSH